MPSIFKPIMPNDVASTRTLLHEAIPLTGTILSGTYITDGPGTHTHDDVEANVKNYTHGMFQSIYDYPYLSSSANHILDITSGYSARSDLSASSNIQNSKKINIYNQMAQMLVGHDLNGDIRDFDQNGDMLDVGGVKYKEAMFLSFSRLLTKDEIKKGSFEMTLGVGSAFATPFSSKVIIKDLNAQNDYRINSPAGEYAVLYMSNSKEEPINESVISTDWQSSGNYYACGLLYYQAGIAVLDSKLFYKTQSGQHDGLLSASVDWFEPNDRTASDKGNSTVSGGVGYALKSEEISGSAFALRHRIQNIQIQ